MDKYQTLDRIITPEVKGIIVDFDGTLVNLFVNWHDLKKELSDEYHLPQGLLLNEILSQIKKSHGLVALRKAFGTIEKYELMFPEKSVFHKSLLQRIKRLHENGIRFSIFSNNMLKTIDYFLAKEKTTSLFDPIISKERVTKLKPDSEGIKMILSLWKLSKEKVLYIGDSAYDQIVGKACGIKTVLI